MSAENMDFTTASGVALVDVLDPNKNGILTQGAHFGGFSVSHNFIEKVAQYSRSDGKNPDERNIGRECYSFSERENRMFIVAIREAELLVSKINQLNGGKSSLITEVDAIGNLYFKVKGERESIGEGFQTHMVGSHFDSVENGGKYDGVAGIAAGLETLQQVLFHQAQGTLQNSFCLAVFRSEESSPNNGIACLGSSIATGTIDAEELESVVYTKQNGRNITLKEHLESSLKKYFQAKANSIRGERGEILWGEGEEYIDHEWWYWFCEKQGISEKNYTAGDWWNKILEGLKNKRITSENTTTYHELHIEQGTLIAGADAHLGIVSGGIGGAKRYKTMQTIPVETIEVSGNDYEIYSFDIFGVSDHTGSTPNNPTLESAEYRKDAQIAANIFLRLFLEKDFGELVSSTAQNNEGYTKIPFHQTIQLAIHRDKKNDFLEFSKKQRVKLTDSNQVDIGDLHYIQSFGGILCVFRESAKKQIGALLGVSESASNEFQRHREEKPYGTTRATLTNVHLTPEGLHFQLDVREVDRDDVERLTTGISEVLQDILPEGIEGLKKVSEKHHEKIDETLKDTAQEVAKILGYRTIFLPSISGHDADRIAAAGIPISMIFVGQQDGVSHNPAEKMTREDYNKAGEVLMKTVLAKLV